MTFFSAIISTITVAVDLCRIALAGVKEIKLYGHRPRFFITNGTDIPIISSAVFARKRDIVADFAREHSGIGPIGRHIFDKLKRGGIFRIILGQIRRHLDWRVNHNIKRKLLGDGGENIAITAPFEAQNPWREIHRPGEHPREDQIGLVRGWIFGLCPAIIFHAACAFTADPIGVSPAKASVLDRLVRVDGDPVFRGLLNNL